MLSSTGDSTGRGDGAFLLALDTTGRVCAFPPSAERATGYLAADIVGTDPFEPFFAHDAPRVRRELLSARDQPAQCSATLRTCDGRSDFVTWWCLSSGASATDTSKYILVGLRRSTHDTEPGPHDGSLAAGLAHEIRNPLNGASLHLSVLERALGRSGTVSQSVRDALSVIRSELHRVSSFVTDFLEFARPRPLLLTSVDAKEIVRRVLDRLRPASKTRGVDLFMEAAAEPLVASLDPDRIERAVLRVAENGIEAATGVGRVVIRIGAKDGILEIDVEDDGPGISLGHAPIFDPFYTTKPTGTGLGLSIARRAVRDHGGDLTVTSDPGRTVFRLRIPARADDS
jgi:signal transduction histidine kinase